MQSEVQINKLTRKKNNNRDLEQNLRFIADVHAGKLARLLRLFGFDTFYRNDITTPDLVKKAVEENRVLLSRNPVFSKNNSLRFVWIESEDPMQQMAQLNNHFSLQEKFQPLSRCLVCNGLLQKVAKEKIVFQLKENTRLFYEEFWQCDSCHRVYWKGPHYERMKKVIACFAT
jgi:uncharacterized protein